MTRIDVAFAPVSGCPLCRGHGIEKAVLRRKWYSFGRFRIRLPSAGIPLLACERCNLLYKAFTPEAGGFARIMAAAAADVWRPKKGVHPAVAPIHRHLPDGPIDVIDIGASNGDLLAQLAGRARRLSALDIERFPRCDGVVTGEYIIGEIDKPLAWSGQGYGLVTAFDVFEHFSDVRTALDNVMNLVAPGGLVMVETGDWTTARKLASWYYVSLFEHHVFWSRSTFDYVCQTRPCSLVAYEVVEHKGRRALSATKRGVLRVVTAAAGVPGCAWLVQSVTGRDPTLLGSPGCRDHAFVVLRRTPAEGVSPTPTGSGVAGVREREASCD